jgi:hypothetical protein
VDWRGKAGTWQTCVLEFYFGGRSKPAPLRRKKQAERECSELFFPAVIWRCGFLLGSSEPAGRQRYVFELAVF